MKKYYQKHNELISIVLTNVNNVATRVQPNLTY
jgi:hypothetical protein